LSERDIWRPIDPVAEGWSKPKPPPPPAIPWWKNAMLSFLLVGCAVIFAPFALIGLAIGVSYAIGEAALKYLRRELR